jgi:hypothetical protein
VLITSQYSQKQAEELKEELRERDRRASLRRQQAEQQRRGMKPGSIKQAAPKSDNENRRPGPMEQQRSSAGAARSFDIQGLWKKVRGQDEKGEGATETPAQAAQ